MYTRQQVEKESLEYFNGDRLAMDTWIGKYCLKDQLGNYYELTPDDMFKRLATEFSRVENGYSNPLPHEKILEYFKNWQIVPQGSVLNIVGNPFVQGSPANCVTLDEPFDSYSGILYTDTQLVSLYKRRYGAGVSLDTLRPSGAIVQNPALSSTGVVSFAERYSNTTRETAQNGRRAALLMCLSVYHPDIENFIDAKLNLTKITGANISVKVDNRFMYAVANNEDITLHWPIDKFATAEIKRVINAKFLWDKIVDANRRSAEPGLAFIDTINDYSPSDCYPGLKSTTSNPCGEIFMSQDSCRLITVNLLPFVDNPFTPEASFDFINFSQCVYDAQRLMDDLVDLDLECLQRIIDKVQSDPEPEHVKSIELETMKQLYSTAQMYRRTGLGLLGLADVFAAMGYSYTSQEALQLAELIMQHKMENEFESSIDLAMERGAFANYDSDVESHSTFIKFFKVHCPDLHSKMLLHGRRNISISTISPTGSIATLAQVSSGMEPVYQLEYIRRKKVMGNNVDDVVDFVDDTGDKWQEYKVKHDGLQYWQDLNPGVPIENNPYKGSTAHEIDPLKKLELHAVLQKYTTHSISNTYNLPETVTNEEISNLYFQAWKKGIKGITVYVEGSRSGVLVSNATHAKQNGKPVKRPQILPCELHTFNQLEDGKLEQWLAFVGLHEGKPFEIFIGKRDWMLVPANYDKLTIEKYKTEEGNKYYLVAYLDGEMFVFGDLARCFKSEFWNYSKLISGLLRHNMPIEYVVRTIETMKFDEVTLHSWQNGVVRVLKSYITEGTLAKDSCKQCGGVLIFTNGCQQCRDCNWSKC